MDIAGYLSEIQKVHATGVATEHAYRPALEKLFKSISPDVTAINEPKGIKVGRPDFVFLRSAGKGAEITVGHCEAKDIGLGLNPKGMNDFNKAQHDRYVKALPNLVYTNGVDFRFYKKGELAREISIADFLMGIQPKPDQFEVLANQLKDFAAEKLQTIESAERLAEMMAGKATLIKDILYNTLKEDADLQTELMGQYQSFKKMLIHDLTAEDFADIYAETIAYGMFGARLHDMSLATFSRVEALELMPKSNPFLRKLFTYVAGPELDDRIRRTVDELAEIFQATDLQKLFEDFGKFTQRNDPFIHFYETFLAQYNPAKRKARGVWYTPEPVVNFIVRAVDDVLKTEFGLADGLADTSKVTIDWDTGVTKNGKAVTTKKEVHRVQILDPAAGTGTFLAEVIKQIAPKVKDVAEGQWSSYVEKELIPRLHGFELLMASYAMCHMKLDMMLTEMGYKPTTNPPRMGVYLTNSLEEGDREIQDLFWARYISEEAKYANTIKRDMPIMCVIGNPPYSGQSSNKGHWITGLMEAYKKEPGGKEKLKERNPKWVNNDYIKFIRMSESLITKNLEGILGFITSNSYLESPTFRGMRWHLSHSFEELFIVNLHGDANIRELVPIGEQDENVFDIMEGVCLLLAVKKSSKKNSKIATIRYADIWGSRSQKSEKLFDFSIGKIQWHLLKPIEPYYFFKPKSEATGSDYQAGFSLTDLFVERSTGYYTSADDYVIGYSKVELLKQMKEFPNLKHEVDESLICRTTYRPLDNRLIYYDPKMLTRSRKNFVQEIALNDNLILICGKSTKSNDINHFFLSKMFSELKCGEATKGSYMFPLRMVGKELLNNGDVVNFAPKIHKAIIAAAKDKARGEPDELAVFDYIYGVLHCPAYRETYKEFLKIDFPRVPYPPSPDVFWDVSAKGSELRKLHLMEEAAIGPAPYKFTGEGDTTVAKVEYKLLGEDTGAVYINNAQAFQDVPQIAWNFYIGGYQPAQKWLKDRRGRPLSFEDIKHYQKIIKILSETDRIMKTIEMPL